MKIEIPWDGIVSIDDKFGRHIGIDDSDQRQLLAWFAREKPEMVRETMGVDKGIAELKDLINALENMEPERGSENWCAIQAYKRSIALLKGEVGK